MNNKFNIKKLLTIVVLIAVVVTVFIVNLNRNEKTVVGDQSGGQAPEGEESGLGSITDGQGYNATTTGSQAQGITGVAQLKTGYGMLGSYVITGANTGTVNFYDATTTNINNRTNNTSTSSILIASFPTNVAAGTYVFDTSVTQGLIAVVSGTAATGTITYK